MAKGIILAGIFIISLFLTTFLISYFNVGFNGDDRVKIIDLPKYHNEALSTQSDYTNNQTCQNALASYSLVSGSWSCSASGLSITGGGMLENDNHINHPDGIYTNYYHIVGVSGDYTIVVTDVRTLNNDPVIWLKIKPDGIYVPETMKFYPIPRWETGKILAYIPIDIGINKDAKIKTVYNINNNDLKVTFNDIEYDIKNYLVDGNQLPDVYLMPLSVAYNFGVIATDSLTITDINQNFAPVSQEIDSSITGALSTLMMIVNFGWSMLLLTLYQFPYDILPLEAQLVIIAPQEFLIFIGILLFGREG